MEELLLLLDDENRDQEHRKVKGIQRLRVSKNFFIDKTPVIIDRIKKPK